MRWCVVVSIRQLLLFCAPSIEASCSVCWSESVVPPVLLRRDEVPSLVVFSRLGLQVYNIRNTRPVPDGIGWTGSFLFHVKHDLTDVTGRGIARHKVVDSAAALKSKSASCKARTAGTAVSLYKR
jgi:hypothetical protein